MNSSKSVLVLAAAIVLLGGCSGIKEELGIGVKRPPDEFTVYSRAPLSLPPDYALRPPATATGASQSAAPREVARNALVGNAPGAAPSASALPNSSPGLQALLQRTGGDSATSGIRGQVNQESSILVDADQSFVERLMFWADKPDPSTVVDAVQENKRIQENQALNKPVTTGETPTIKRNPRALFEGIF